LGIVADDARQVLMAWQITIQTHCEPTT